MALLFGLGGDKKPKNPKINKKQDYVSNKPQTGFGTVKKPEGTKVGKPTQTSTYKQETSCTSGKPTKEICLPPMQTTTEGLPNPKGKPKETIPPVTKEKTPKIPKEEPETVYKNTLLIGG